MHLCVDVDARALVRQAADLLSLLPPTHWGAMVSTQLRSADDASRACAAALRAQKAGTGRRSGKEAALDHSALADAALAGQGSIDSAP